MPTQGYLLCVGGSDSYYIMANRTIEQIRVYDPIRPICILTDRIEYAKTKITHEVAYVEFQINRHLHPSCPISCDWVRYGLYPKVFSAFYSLFDETLCMDVDMVFHKDFTFAWDTQMESGISIPGISDSENRSPSHWHWGGISHVMQQSRLSLPQMFSTMILYKTETMKKAITKHIHHIMSHCDEWGVLRIFRGGWPDEIIFSILLGLEGLRPNQLLFDWIEDRTNCDPFAKT